MGGQKHRMIYEFDDFRLIPSENLLLRNGEAIPLKPKSFATLVLLVEQHGHLVEKSELIERIWENSFVEEAAVSRCIWSIRSALGEDSKSQRFIQTVPTHGYRFVAEVREIDLNAVATEGELRQLGEPGTQENPAKIDQENTPAGALSRSRIAATACLALLILISLTAYIWMRPTASRKRSIAVLPVRPIGGGNRDELYEVGIADSLIQRLASTNGVVVRPLGAIRKYADLTQDPIAAGKEQQVDYVLESSYQIVGDKVRVSSQLFNIASGSVEDTYKSEKETSDFFGMEDAIANEIGRGISAKFGGFAANYVAKRGTTNEEAYRLYLQGTYLNDRREGGKAVELFDKAIQLDPNYAMAWVGKALAHFTIAGNARLGNIQEEHLKSSEAIDKALAIDKDLSEAHIALCQNKLLYDYDFDAAERECRRGLELDPNSSMAHEVNARYLMERGSFDQAISEIKTAIDLEPTCLFCHRNYGMILVYSRRYQDAITQLNRLTTMDKNYGWTYQWLSLAHLLQGHESDAVEMW